MVASLLFYLSCAGGAEPEGAEFILESVEVIEGTLSQEELEIEREKWAEVATQCFEEVDSGRDGFAFYCFNDSDEGVVYPGWQ